MTEEEREQMEFEEFEAGEYMDFVSNPRPPLFTDAEHPLATANDGARAGVVWRLKAAFERARREGMTQRKISEKMGIGNSTLTKYKSKPGLMDRMQVNALCCCLGVDLGWLRYGDCNAGWALTPAQLAKVYCRMSESDRHLVSNLIEKIAPDWAFDDISINGNMTWNDVGIVADGE